MIKKTLLTALCTLPLAPNASLISNNTNTTTTSYVNEEVQEPESCTIMYVGKDVSTTGHSIIARSGDSSPYTMNLFVKSFKHNELANKVIYGKNGFSWKMPSTTYQYTSTPRNPNMNKGLHWEVSGINEKGVGVSATLSCYSWTNPLTEDPLVENGISEDNIAQIVAATASTAREGIETIANIIDTQGSAECNAIMVTDKNESWYMEMYTGHQYMAIKMPTDKVATCGNEFMFDSLNKMGISDPNDYICSQDLLKTAENPTKTTKFAKYDDAGTGLEHLDLYNTYAGYADKQGTFGDGCHMRTWIGQYRFGKPKELTKKYSDSDTESKPKKLEAFFEPNENYQSGKLSPNDIISYMRDRFETVLITPEGGTDDPNKAYFQNQLDEGKGLRYVGSETAYQIHLIDVDPTLPTEMSVTEYMCLSNSAYSPFIPMNNCMTSFIPEYTKVTTDYSFDEGSAPSIYKRLNALAAMDRQHFGKPTEEFIIEHETAWQNQYIDLLQQAKNKKLSEAKSGITNFSKMLQKYGLLMSMILYDDLLFFIENQLSGYKEITTTFTPLVSLEYYSKLYGWSYKQDGKNVTLTSGNDTIKFDLNYKWAKTTPYCTMTKNNETPVLCQMHITDGIPYVQYDGLTEITVDKTKYELKGIRSAITTGHEVVKLNIDDFIDGQKAPWYMWFILSILVAGSLATTITLPLVLKKKKLAKRK